MFVAKGYQSNTTLCIEQITKVQCLIVRSGFSPTKLIDFVSVYLLLDFERLLSTIMSVKPFNLLLPLPPHSFVFSTAIVICTSLINYHD